MSDYNRPVFLLVLLAWGGIWTSWTLNEGLCLGDISVLIRVIWKYGFEATFALLLQLGSAFCVIIVAFFKFWGTPKTISRLCPVTIRVIEMYIYTETRTSTIPPMQ